MKKKSAFTLRSGNKPAFKNIGGSILNAVADAIPSGKNAGVDKRSAKEKADAAAASKISKKSAPNNEKEEGKDKKGKLGKFMGKHGGDILSAIGGALPKYN